MAPVALDNDISANFQKTDMTLKRRAFLSMLASALVLGNGWLNVLREATDTPTATHSAFVMTGNQISRCRSRDPGRSLDGS